MAAVLSIVLTGLALDASAPITAAEPDPVAVWPSGPLDVVAAFRKPVDQRGRRPGGQDHPLF